MDKQEIVSKFFSQINRALDFFKGKRDTYYIAKECLCHSDYSPKPLSVKDENAFPPFITSFFYLQKKARHELAERIYRDAFFDMTPESLIDHHVNMADPRDWNRFKYNYLMSMDQTISFLAHLGNENDMERLNLNPPGELDSLICTELEAFINSNWVKLFKKFQRCEEPFQCHSLLLEIFGLCKQFTGDIGSIKDALPTLDFRKWLLKRQLLGLHTAIQVDCFYRGYFWISDKSPKIVEKIAELAGDIYNNYVFLICYSLDKYVFSALEILETIKKVKDIENRHIWYEYLSDNLIHQVKKISRRYSDVKDLLECTTGVTIPLKWTEEIAALIKKSKPKRASVEELIDWLRKAEGKLKKANKSALRPENIAPIIEKIKKSILNGQKSFWRRCRNRFSPDRVRLLVASLDNKYSTESASMFKTPAVKLDGEQSIPTELCVLKKWGSTASIFEEDKDYNSSYGGGFFLMHNGVGLCIDPGPDFLRNLTQYTDFDITDITGVACTHTHYDHFADFKRILLGIREYNREVGYKRLYYYLPDQDDQKMHPKKMREDFCVNVFEEAGPHPHKPGGKKYYYIPNTSWGKRHGIRIHPIKVTHKIYKGRSRSYALLVEPLNDGQPLSKILFSGDAEYKAEIFSGYEPELLVLNCASVRFKDITAVRDASNLPAARRAKKNQLGYTGILSLLFKMREYKLALLSDFFEAQGELDSRLFITGSLKNDLDRFRKAGKAILAAEPGVRIRWDTADEKNVMKIHCSFKCAPDSSGFIEIKNDNKFDQFKTLNFPRKTPIIFSCGECCKKIKKNLFL